MLVKQPGLGIQAMGEVCTLSHAAWSLEPRCTATPESQTRSILMHLDSILIIITGGAP